MSLMLTQTFSKWLAVIDYTINKDFIAKNLCENRNMPALNCKGNCQLMKKLAAEDDQSNKTAPASNVIKISFSEIWMDNSLPSEQLPSLPNDIIYNSVYLTFFPTLFTAAIFHPPCA